MNTFNINDRLNTKNTKTIIGYTTPKVAGVVSEKHTISMDRALSEMKKSVAYSVTLEQYLYVKAHGGSEWLRDLITWFMGQEKKAIEGAILNEKDGGFSFLGYPVLFDVDTRAPMWETYFWAKEHDEKNKKKVRDHFNTQGVKI